MDKGVEPQYMHNTEFNIVILCEIQGLHSYGQPQFSKGVI